MPAPYATAVLYSDVLTPAQIDAMYPGGKHPDIISDSEHFPTVPSESFDFVVANHVLEHVTDVLAALGEWHRLLRTGGALLLSVPDKRYTFDCHRKRTPLEHLVEDHNSGLLPVQRNECHLLDWAEHVEGLKPGSPEFVAWTTDQKRMGYSVHNHVWILQDVLRIVQYLSNQLDVHFALVKWNDTSILGNEFTLLLRKVNASSNDSRRRLRLAMVGALLMQPVHEVFSRVRRLARGAKRLRTSVH